jgi:hypothetical protein
MRPGNVEDEDEHNVSTHFLEKFLCSLPVWGIVDGNAFMIRSILKFLNGHVYTWETLYHFFRWKNIQHIDTSHYSAHEGTNHSMKSHSAKLKPTMDLDTSANTINTQTDIKVAELEEIIYRDYYFKHKRCSNLPTSLYTVSNVEAILKKMMSRVHLYKARMTDDSVFQAFYSGDTVACDNDVFGEFDLDTEEPEDTEADERSIPNPHTKADDMTIPLFSRIRTV